MDHVIAPPVQVQLVDLDADLSQLLDVATRLAADGFRPGIPPTLLPRTIAIDARACARMVCRRCGHAGLRYQPYSRKHGNASGFAYAVLGQCPRCGSVEVA